jgi:non-haem Fe2+, alpha-ketoglutarate-dependent halogenase
MARLSQAAIDRNGGNGHVSATSVLAASEGAAYRARFGARRHRGRCRSGGLRPKSHLLLTRVNEIVPHAYVLRAIESIIDLSILAWSTSLFMNEPHNTSVVFWHQDLSYGDPEPRNIVTAWVAVSESAAENGAMRDSGSFEHCRPEKRPEADPTPEAIAQRAQVTGDTRRILMRSTAKAM